MLSFDSRLGYEIPHRNLPIWVTKIPTQMPVIRFEEEEEGASYEIPNSSDELTNWWEKFRLRHKYPLYCMILATEADENIALLVENHREELAKISGDKCCFVYFRDIEKAKLLEQFRFVEHARGVMQFIKIIEVQPNRLPCLLFFEQLTSGKYVYVDIENKSVTELVRFLRELFTFIYSQKTVSLTAVKAFRTSKQVRIAKEALGRNLAQFGKEIIGELIKSLTKLP